MSLPHPFSPTSTPATTTNDTNTTNSHSLTFGMNLIVILAGLLCALFFALSLSAVIHLLLLRLRGHRNAPENNDDVEKQADEKDKDNCAVPVLVFSSAGAGAEHAECAICLAEFVDGDAVRVLPACSHGFHVACIQRWLNGHSSCPTCRTCCSAVSKESGSVTDS